MFLFKTVAVERPLRVGSIDLETLHLHDCIILVLILTADIVDASAPRQQLTINVV